MAFKRNNKGKVSMWNFVSASDSGETPFALTAVTMSPAVPSQPCLKLRLDTGRPDFKSLPTHHAKALGATSQIPLN